MPKISKLKKEYTKDNKNLKTKENPIFSDVYNYKPQYVEKFKTLKKKKNVV